jgi:hypothetical protein
MAMSVIAAMIPYTNRFDEPLDDPESGITIEGAFGAEIGGTIGAAGGVIGPAAGAALMIPAGA